MKNKSLCKVHHQQSFLSKHCYRVILDYGLQLSSRTPHPCSPEMTLGTGKKATHGNTTRATFSALTGKQRKAGLPRSPNLRGYQVMLAARNEVTCAFNRTPSHNDCWTMSEPSILHGAGMWSCCAEAVLWRRCLWVCIQQGASHRVQ
jgi:hypothetical protein